MDGTELKPSSRLARAADAERQDIARKRARLARRHGQLAGELAEIEASLAELAEREQLIVRLLAAPDTDGIDTQPEGVRSSEGIREPQKRQRALLRGPQIRETAVRVLAGSPHAGAIHYRDWYQLLCDAGYEVAGKDPLAVFLTQITRSPLVGKSTQAGVYTLERETPLRLRRELAQLERSLREVTSESGNDLAQVRARREQVLSEIRHTERALTEAERVLAAGQHEATPHAASA